MNLAGVSYADQQGPVGMSATAQGLFAAMVYGFGAAVGGLLGGLLLGGMDGRSLFFIFGIIVLLGLAVVMLFDNRNRSRANG